MGFYGLKDKATDKYVCKCVLNATGKEFTTDLDKASVLGHLMLFNEISEISSFYNEQHQQGNTLPSYSTVKFILSEVEEQPSAPVSVEDRVAYEGRRDLLGA
jgi:hypothetical protein